MGKPSSLEVGWGDRGRGLPSFIQNLDFELLRNKVSYICLKSLKNLYNSTVNNNSLGEKLGRKRGKDTGERERKTETERWGKRLY